MPRRRWVDGVVIAALVGATLVVHDVGYALGHPYWLDETWVADSIRAPLAKLPFLTSSSPLGWSVLLRLVPGAASGQSARLVPLAFSALAAVAGYALGEQLGRRRYVAGLIVGVAVLLSPALLTRADLKQYTAEAFSSVALLAIAARLETAWSRGGLVVLAAFTGLGLLIAPTEVFVAAAVFAGLLLETAIGRNRRQAVEVVVAGGAAAAGIGVSYALTVAPNVIPSLRDYWNSYYLPPSGRILSVVHSRLDQLAPIVGFRHQPLLAVLPVAGVVVLARAGRWAVALAAPVAVAINGLAAVTRNYPFGDQRTSTYWLVLVPVLAAVAVAWAADWAMSRNRMVGLAVVVAALVAWTINTDPYIRSRPLPAEDVRDQVTYFEAHFRPGDVLILDENASFGFAFYDHRLRPDFVRVGALATGFLPEYPSQRWIVQMYARDATAVSHALATATARAELPDALGRIWIIRSHPTTSELQAWVAALPESEVRTMHGSSEPLLLYTPAPSG